jgi:hypothetical protein
VNLVGEAAGWAGGILIVAAFWTPSDRRLNQLLAAGLFLMCAHLAGLGAFTAAVAALCGAARCAATLRWPGSAAAALVPSVAMAILAWPTWTGAASMLALAGAMGTNLVLATQSGRMARLMMLPVNAVWLLHHAMAGSFPALATELCCAAGNCWTASRKAPAAG